MPGDCSPARSVVSKMKTRSACFPLVPAPPSAGRGSGTAFFFFPAEDGIRDWSVTGVQTCALPIFHAELLLADAAPAEFQILFQFRARLRQIGHLVGEKQEFLWMRLREVHHRFVAVAPG